MIYYSSPYTTDKNIGKFYNQFLEILPSNEDWACFIDGDTLFTTYDYGYLIEKVVAENPSVDCFTAYTNRVACEWQIAPNVDKETDDIKYHRKFGEDLKSSYRTSVMDVTDKPRNSVLSGFFILLKKQSWIDIGRFKETGMLGVDNDLHWKLQDCGKKLMLMQGLYLYHWYRGGDRSYKKHLI